MHIDWSLTSITVNSVIKLALMALLGIAGAKMGIMDEVGTAKASKIMLNIGMPMMLLAGFFTPFDSSRLTEMLWCFLASFMSEFIAIILCSFFIKRKNNPDAVAEECAAIFSNCGAIGLPLAVMIMGQNAAFYVASYLTINSFYLWIYAPLILSGKVDAKSVKKALLSPCLIAIYVGLVIFFVGIPIPSIAQEAVNTVSGCVTPLAMLTMGAMIYRSDIKALFKNARMYYTCFLKLFLLPLGFLVFLKLAHVPSGPALASYIVFACPTASAVPVLVEDSGRNGGYAAGITCVTTLLSMITIPVLVAIYSFW